MANTGNVIGTSAADIGGGSFSWSSVSSAQQNNDVGASCSQNNSLNSNNLAITSFDMSAIPDGATIDGILVTSRLSSSGTNGYRENLHLTKDGTTKVGNNEWAHESISGGWTNYTDGGATSLWGTTWTAAEVKASTFGVILQTQKTGSTARYQYVDCIWIDVYYTPIATGEPTHMMHYKKLRAN